MASVKLFYSQRLGNFRDIDPSPKQLIFVLPLICLQIIGPMISLVLLAAYFKSFVLVFVLFMIAVQFLVMQFLYFKGKQIDCLEKLYQPEEEDFIEFKVKGLQESKMLF